LCGDLEAAGQQVVVHHLDGHDAGLDLLGAQRCDDVGDVAVPVAGGIRQCSASERSGSIGCSRTSSIWTDTIFSAGTGSRSSTVVPDRT